MPDPTRRDLRPPARRPPACRRAIFTRQNTRATLAECLGSTMTTVAPHTHAHITHTVLLLYLVYFTRGIKPSPASLAGRGGVASAKIDRRRRRRRRAARKAQLLEQIIRRYYYYYYYCSGLCTCRHNASLYTTKAENRRRTSSTTNS